MTAVARPSATAAVGAMMMTLASSHERG